MSSAGGAAVLSVLPVNSMGSHPTRRAQKGSPSTGMYHRYHACLDHSAAQKHNLVPNKTISTARLADGQNFLQPSIKRNVSFMHEKAGGWSTSNPTVPPPRSL